MKKILLLLTLAIGCCSYAQQTTTVTTTTKTTKIDSLPTIFTKKHEVKLGSIKLLAGGIIEGTYEYIYNEDFTFGASILGNLDSGGNDYPENFSITPFARFYFNESREYGAKGFFVEGFAKYLTGKQTTYYYTGDGTEYDIKENFSGGAAGISLGWKWINRSGFVFELLVGGGRVFSGDDNAPDAVFRGDFNLGYRF
jgi:hypothetical protein